MSLIQTNTSCAILYTARPYKMNSLIFITKFYAHKAEGLYLSEYFTKIGQGGLFIFCLSIVWKNAVRPGVHTSIAMWLSLD